MVYTADHLRFDEAVWRRVADRMKRTIFAVSLVAAVLGLNAASAVADGSDSLALTVFVIKGIKDIQIETNAITAIM